MDNHPENKAQAKIESLTKNLLDSYEELDLIYRVSKGLMSTLDVEKMAGSILSEAMETFEAEVGWLYLTQSQDFPFEFMRKNIDERTVRLINSFIVKELTKRGRSNLFYNLRAQLGLADDKIPGPFICSLLKKEQEIIGALCLGRCQSDDFFSTGDLKLADALSTQAAFALENYRLFKEKEEKERIQKIFSSYLNPHVVEDLLEKDDSFLFEVAEKKVAVLFSDVRDFTTISQLLEPQEVAGLLNEYYSQMFSAIFDYNGTLYHYIGDGIMALWGAPLDDEQACLNALRSSFRMFENLKTLNEKILEDSRFKKIIAKLDRENLLKIGIGINFAEIVVGYIGPEMRMQYTAIGDGVNTASRVEGLNKELDTELLITRAVYEEVGDHAEVNHLGLTPCKGRDPVDVYQVLRVGDD